MLRLDRYITACGAASRKEAASAIRRGEVLVNGAAVRDPAVKLDEQTAQVIFRGTILKYSTYAYVMLNKPRGYVSATEDRHLPYVLSLLSPEHQRRGLFPVGRLDRDTVGLLLMTDDGETAHRLLSPRRGVEKIYRFTCKEPISDEDVARFREGMTIDGGELCRPAKLSPDADRRSGEVTLTEGKYHEVKRMFEAVGNRILTLERISFGGIKLDPLLARGEWRELTSEEILHITELVKS